jgi:hypothetical protein
MHKKVTLKQQLSQEITLTHAALTFSKVKLVLRSERYTFCKYIRQISRWDFIIISLGHHVVDDGEAENEVAVTRNRLDTDFLSGGEPAHNLTSPQVGDLDGLVGTRHDAKLLKIEQVLVGRHLAPVDENSHDVTA